MRTSLCGGHLTQFKELYCVHADVLTEGIWKTLAELKDPELRKLAASLPETVMRSRADSTAHKYVRAFRHWQVWAGKHQEVAMFPVSDVHFALYLQHLGDTMKSRAAVEEAVNATSWIHQLSGLPSVIKSPFVAAVRVDLCGGIHQHPTN